MTEVPPPSDDLVGHECDRCGRTYPDADYNNEPGFCVKPWAPEDTSATKARLCELLARRETAHPGVTAKP